MYYKKIYLLLVSMLLGIGASAQSFGVSTNALGWAALTPNIGLDVGLAKHFSFEVDAGINPFTYAHGMSSRFWAVQPEFKYWFREKFTGPSLGLHGTWGTYDFGLWKYIYKGQMYGGGLSLNYAWILSDHWNLEATLGGGYTRLDQKKKVLRSDPLSCYGPETFDKWGLTRAGLTFTYFFGKINPDRTAKIAARIKKAEAHKWAKSDYEYIRAAVRDGVNEVTASRKDTVVIIREIQTVRQAPEYKDVRERKSFEVFFGQGSDKPSDGNLGDLLGYLYGASLQSFKIHLSVSCSPEGGEALNKDLARRRADWALDHLRNAGIDSGEIGILSQESDWERFLELVPTCPMEHGSTILEMLRSSTNHENSLNDIRSKYPDDWKAIEDHVFPKMRNVTIVVDAVRRIEVEK